MPRNRGKRLSACGAKHDFLLVLYSEDTSIVQLGTRFAALKTAVVGAASVPGPLDENFADPQTTVAALVPVHSYNECKHVAQTAPPTNPLKKIEMANIVLGRVEIRKYGGINHLTVTKF